MSSRHNLTTALGIAHALVANQPDYPPFARRESYFQEKPSPHRTCERNRRNKKRAKKKWEQQNKKQVQKRTRGR